MYGDDCEPGHPFVLKPGGDPLPRILEEIRRLEGLVGTAGGLDDALSVLIARVEGDVAFSPGSDAWWGPFLGTVGSLDTPRRKARRAYARTILHAYRSFAREAPTRGLTAAASRRVRDAGLPTMNVDQMYNYATSNKFPELP